MEVDLTPEHGKLTFTEDRKYVLCHECTAQVRELSHHLRWKHKMTAAQYRERHGLKKGLPLIAPEQQAKRALGAYRRIARDGTMHLTKHAFRPGNEHRYKKTNNQ